MKWYRKLAMQKRAQEPSHDPIPPSWKLRLQRRLQVPSDPKLRLQAASLDPNWDVYQSRRFANPVGDWPTVTATRLPYGNFTVRINAPYTQLPRGDAVRRYNQAFDEALGRDGWHYASAVRNVGVSLPVRKFVDSLPMFSRRPARRNRHEQAAWIYPGNKSGDAAAIHRRNMRALQRIRRHLDWYARTVWRGDKSHLWAYYTDRPGANSLLPALPTSYGKDRWSKVWVEESLGLAPHLMQGVVGPVRLSVIPDAEMGNRLAYAISRRVPGGWAVFKSRTPFETFAHEMLHLVHGPGGALERVPGGHDGRWQPAAELIGEAGGNLYAQLLRGRVAKRLGTYDPKWPTEFGVPHVALVRRWEDARRMGMTDVELIERHLPKLLHSITHGVYAPTPSAPSEVLSNIGRARIRRQQERLRIPHLSQGYRYSDDRYAGYDIFRGVPTSREVETLRERYGLIPARFRPVLHRRETITLPRITTGGP